MNHSKAVDTIVSLGDRAAANGVDGLVDLDDLHDLSSIYREFTGDEAFEDRGKDGHFLNPSFIEWLEVYSGTLAA